jgi:SAM-dependent methyltransferase
VKESDIRPAALFAEYLGILREDGARLLQAAREFVPISCPACASTDYHTAFQKEGYRYRICGVCGSLFVSPRPTLTLLDAYYRESRAVEFWGTRFFRDTAEARRQKMFRPRAREIQALMQRADHASRRVLLDIGSGYGLFLEEMARLEVFDELVGIEPAPVLAAACRERGFRVIESAVESADGQAMADVATAYEVLEHVFDPCTFLVAAARLVRPHGLLVFTTLTASGFDIQVLWQHSKSVSPPQHLNLLSLAGIESLVRRSGLQIVDLSTPGRLDVDIVRNTAADNPAVALPRFVRRLLEAGPACERDFQEFLARHRLSSHVRVVARVAEPPLTEASERL